MRRLLLPIALVAGALVASPAAAHAQSTRIEIRKDSRGDVVCYRNDRRVDCDTLRSDERDALDRAERDRERERERARDRAEDERARSLERAQEARERALERARDDRERALARAEEARRAAAETRRQQLDWAESLRRDLARDRARQEARREALRRQRWYDDLRPRVSLGAGADIRRFDDVNRYVAQGGVDFHTSSGLGMRPEVVYGWTDRRTEQLPLVICASCSSTPPTAQLRSRSQMLGVNLNGTYTMLRRSFVRPYLLGGVGVLSTREVTPVIATSAPLAGTALGTQVTYTTDSHDRVDFGLNTGAGLEFGHGPVRLYTEFRYFLTDNPTARGFSGMLPITAGLRF